MPSITPLAVAPLSLHPTSLAVTTDTQVRLWLLHNQPTADDTLGRRVVALLPTAEFVHIHQRAELTTAVGEQPMPCAVIIPVPLAWMDAYQLADELRRLLPDSLPILLTQGKFTIPQLSSGHLISIDHPRWGETLQQVVMQAQERQQAAVLARRQAAILALLSTVSQQIFLPGQLEKVLEHTLPRLGSILALNRIMLFERVAIFEEPAQFYQRYQWNKRTTPTIHINHPRWFPTTFEEWGIERWLERLQQGLVVYGNETNFAATERQFLQEVMHTESVLMVPIFNGDNWWGFLAFDDNLPNRQWQTAEIDALCALANVVGAAIENARLFTAERLQVSRAQELSTRAHQQTMELASLYDISLALTGVLDPATIMARLETHISQRLQPDIIVAVLLDEEMDEFEVIAAKERGEPLLHAPLGHRLAVSQGGLSGWVIREKRVLLIGDLETEPLPAVIRQITRHMPRTWLGMPLLANGRVVGVISVQSYEPYAYDRGHVRFLEMVATQAALAIESARLYQQEANQRREAELINQLTTELNHSALDHERILQTAVETVHQYIPDIGIALVNMLDETRDFLIPQALWAAEERYIITPLGQRIPVGQTQMARHAIEEGQTVVQEDLHLVKPANERAAWIVSQGLRAIMYVPVKSKGQVIGLFNINIWHVARRFRKAEISFCELVASHVGITLENAQLYAREARRRQEAELLHTLTASLIQTQNLRQIAEHALDVLQKRLPRIQSCYISLLDATGEFLQTLTGWGTDVIAPLGETEANIPLKSTNSTRRALEERRTVYVADLREQANPNPRTEEMIKHGLRTLLYIPLVAKERPVGILQIHGLYQPIHLTQAELSFAEAVANHVSLAAENARLLEAERAQLHLSQTLRQVGALLTTSLSLDEVFERIFDLLAQVVRYDAVTIQLYDEVNDQMYLAGGRGFEDMRQTAEIVQALGGDTINRMANLSYQIVEDTASATFNEWIPVENFAPIRSAIRCALRIKDQLIGVLNVDSFSPHSYTEEMAQTVVAFANQAVIAIENARLYEEVNQRVEKLSIFNEVAIITTTANTVEDILQKTAQLLATKLYHERMGILLVDETKTSLITHLSFYKRQRIRPPFARIPLDSPHGVIPHVARTGQPYLCMDALEDPLYIPYDPLMRAELTVPLKVDEQVIGVINVESSRPNAFNEEDGTFLYTLAQQLATAVQRAQLYEASQFYAVQLEEQVARRTAELQHEKDRNMAILDTAGEGIIFTDKMGRIIYANPAMCQQTGYSKQELLNQTPRILKSGANASRLYEEMWATIGRGERWRGELTNRRKDGSLYASGVIITPLQDTQGEIIGFVSVQSDISQLKELDRLKSEFVTNVSHELRTPLTNIRTFVTLLRRGKPEKMAHYHTVLERETERLTRLIQDLLDLSRIEMNTIETNLRPENILALLEDLMHSFDFKAQEKQIGLTLERPSDLPQVRMDKDQITQVMTNLLGNALAYTPAEGQVAIRVHQGVYQGQPMVAVQVADTGLGMTEEDKERVFERFYRGQAATESRAPGTGLGLPISREIMARHHGGIEVESELGRGTIFTIWLPLAGGGS